MDEATKERERIAAFLWAVFKSSTHGASGLFERAIEAVERNDMNDPVRVADPVGLPAGARPSPVGRR